MRFQLTIFFSLMAFCFTIDCTRIEATQYVSNLNNQPLQQGIGDIHTLLPGDTFSGFFTTGSGVNFFDLNFVTLEFVSPSLQNASTINAQLYQQVGSQFVLVGQLGNPGLDPAPTQWPQSTFYIDYTPLSGLQLQPATEYELMVSEPANGNNANGLLFSQIPNYTTPTDWQMDRVPPAIRFQDRAEELTLAVDASAVPEQGCPVWMVFSGCLLLVGLAYKLSGQTI